MLQYLSDDTTLVGEALYSIFGVGTVGPQNSGTHIPEEKMGLDTLGIFYKPDKFQWTRMRITPENIRRCKFAYRKDPYRIDPHGAPLGPPQYVTQTSVRTEQSLLGIMWLRYVMI